MGNGGTQRYEVVGVCPHGRALCRQLNLADQLHLDALMLQPLSGQRGYPQLQHRLRPWCQPPTSRLATFLKV